MSSESTPTLGEVLQVLAEEHGAGTPLFNPEASYEDASDRVRLVHRETHQAASRTIRRLEPAQKDAMLALADAAPELRDALDALLDELLANRGTSSEFVVMRTTVAGKGDPHKGLPIKRAKAALEAAGGDSP